MSNKVATPAFLLALKQYAEDSMFESSLLREGEAFLKATGLKSVTGIRYVTMSLIIAQAMRSMLDGYSGSSSYDGRFLNEAVGFQLGSGPQLWGEPKSKSLTEVGDRYKELVDVVFALQSHSHGFNAVIETFLRTYR